MDGFYYKIYNSTFVGGGPQPWYYSPKDQNAGNALSDAQIKHTMHMRTLDYIMLGDYFPVDPTELRAVDPTGAITDSFA